MLHFKPSWLQTCRSVTASLAQNGPVCKLDTQFFVHSYSTQSQKHSASDIASSFMEKFQTIGPQKRTQILDANQLQLLSLTLNKNTLYPNSPPLSLLSSQSANETTTTPPDGTPVPPGYHLVYFTPQFLEEHLGQDGTDVSYNPDPPFTRRMWAGGEMLWPRMKGSERPNLLRVGQTVTETTRLLSAEPKIIKKSGEEMVVVGVEKTFENEDGVALIDKRNWVFREALKGLSPKETSSPEKTSLKPQDQERHGSSVSGSPIPSIPFTPANKTYTRRLKQSPVTLFRFSALTFNPHKIHYSVPWAQDVEGHRNIVVHGPLNLISMLDFWRETRKEGERYPEHTVPESVKYRATNPLYADEEYHIVLEDELKNSKVNIYNPEGKVSMNAEIIG
ncbi:hypothetical protein FQN49_000665 [Arthroderma sp. PD_2]|nr:hypothetical protein FQN49_000665 [Arthroderma sp. PD_2]